MERVDRATTDSIEQEVKGRFPEGALSSVEILQYGDDPSVEPGEVVIRLTIASAAARESGEEPMDTFKRTSGAVLKELRHDIRERFPAASRIEIVSDAEPRNRFMMRLETNEQAGELTPVMARLGPNDLETLDTLITAGIATNRAQAVRWTLARIRERPAYAQLRERAREIEDLRSQF
jgi:hypothetical protein